MDRLAGRLSEKIPKGDVDGGKPTHLGTAAGKAEIAIEKHARDPVDPLRITPDQSRGCIFMDIGFRRGRAEKRLAETDQPFIAMDVDPKKVRKFVQTNGLDGRDLHGRRSVSSGVLVTGHRLPVRRLMNPANDSPGYSCGFGRAHCRR